MADSDQTAVPIEEAARILRVNTEALRKRIQRGRLGGYKADGRWYVILPEQRTNVRTPADSRQDGDQTALVHELREQVAWLRAEIVRRDAEVQRRDVLLAEAIRRVPELPAPRAERPDSDETRVQPRRRWWWPWG